MKILYTIYNLHFRDDTTGKLSVCDNLNFKDFQGPVTSNSKTVKAL